MYFLNAFNKLSNKIKILVRIICLSISTLVLVLFITNNFKLNCLEPSDISYNLFLWIPLFTSLYSLRINKFFDNEFFKYLANLSFSFYVLHGPLNIFYSYIATLANNTISPTTGFIIYYILLFPIAVFLNYISNLIIKKYSYLYKKNQTNNCNNISTIHIFDFKKISDYRKIKVNKKIKNHNNK